MILNAVGLGVKMTDQVYFDRSLNQQMVDICFEVEEIIRSGAKETIKAMGRENYVKSDTAVVASLFDLTRADSKNLGLSREILRAEKEFTDFLYDAPGAWSEDEILAYWRGFKDSSLAEAEQHSPYYFLMRGHKDWKQLTSEDADEIIAEAAALHAEITDCKPEEVNNYIVSKGVFTLWWD